MSVFNEIINGKGNPSIRWVATLLTGNTEETTLFTTLTYVEVFAKWVNHPKKKDIEIEVWYYDTAYKRCVAYIGSHTAINEMISELKDLEYCNAL